VASVAPPAASYTRYAYDGQNKQIWSCTWNTASNLCTTDNGYSFYSPAGKLLGTFTITFTPYYYVNNQKVPDSLTITNGTPLAYFGSRRLWVPDRVGSQGRFFPYGEDRTGMNYPQSGQYAFATYLDNGSGVYYADQRWYAAAPGRFLSPDRHHTRTRSPQDLNLFSYAGNDPINRADPTGRTYCDVDFGICYYGDDDDDDDGGGGGGGDDDCVGTEGFSYMTGAACPVGDTPSVPAPQAPPCNTDLPKIDTTLTNLANDILGITAQKDAAITGADLLALGATLGSDVESEMLNPTAFFNGGHFFLGVSNSSIESDLGGPYSLAFKDFEQLFNPNGNGRRYPTPVPTTDPAHNYYLHDHSNSAGDLTFHFDRYNPYPIGLGTIRHGAVDVLYGSLGVHCLDPAWR
jgi:RHS repeat-associated protein